MKVAVVGSGISGVVSSHILDEEHDVTLYEKRDRLGGHAHTVSVTLDDLTHPVDTGFLVYNERNYPLFTRFLDELNVPTKTSSMSFSFRSEVTGIEYGGGGLSSFFSQRSNLLRLDHWRILADIIRFYNQAPEDRENASRSLTLRNYLDESNYSEAFINEHLLPMVASIWSVPVKRARRFPFVYVVDFFRNHGLLQFYDRPQWRTIEGGSRVYLDRFRNSFSGKILVDNPVESIQPDGSEVTVSSDQHIRTYDAVVVATHSDQARDILAPEMDDIADTLGSIPYESNKLTLHTDSSVLPENEAIWSSWNYHQFEESDGATLTYDVSVLQDLPFDEEVCITLNADDRIDSEMVLDRFEYSHPVYNEESLRAQEQLRNVENHSSVFFAGAWMGNGFHEDGARSARRAARNLGVEW